jgi:hypothetical protein
MVLATFLAIFSRTHLVSLVEILFRLILWNYLYSYVLSNQEVELAIESSG